MKKTLIFHHLLDLNDLPAMERWFYRYHVPEVLRDRRPLHYASYAAVPPPPGAEAFGCLNYKLHESITLDETQGSSGLLAMTAEVVPLRVVIVNVPVLPTEDFLGKELSFEERTIFRWVTVFRYPEGVEVEEADRWYVEVHAREVVRQPGLIRFFSYRVVPEEVPLQKGGRSFLHPETRVSSNWHRVSELWYENANGWAESVVTSPPAYTKPAWARWSDYPFFEPGVDFVSMFILERPTDDWVRDARPFYV